MNSVLTKKKSKAQLVFNEYIRLRDCLETTGSPFAAICFTCGKETTNMDRKLSAGHFILDSKHGNSTSFDEHNVHAQCTWFCNRMKHGNLGEYAVHILKKYGQDELDRLQSLKLVSKKWTIDELEEIIKKYKEKIKNIYA